MVKAIVFDMDGVLFDTESLFISCWKTLADEMQLEHFEEVLKKCIGTNVDKTKEIIVSHYGTQFDYDSYQGKTRKLFAEHINTKGMPMKPGVYELLGFLKENDYKIGLASSTRLDMVVEELKNAGIYEYFEVIVGGDMVTHSKPHPKIYQVACEKLGVKPEETIAIEDSLNGIRSAFAAGMKPIMVPDLVLPTEEITPLLYKKFSSLLEVKAFLEGNMNP